MENTLSLQAKTMKMPAFCSGGKLPIQYESESFLSTYHIVYCPTVVINDYDGWLSEEERDYYDQLKFEKRKSSFLRGRIAAKNAITELTGNDQPATFAIGSGIFKFPIVAGIPNVNVSISHTDHLALALSFPEVFPMGIDIEKTDNSKLAVMKTQNFEIDKIVNLICLSPETAHTMLWTIKESLSKILKTGLTINFNLLKIESISERNGIYTSKFSNFHQYKALSFVWGGYVCSIVLPFFSEVNLSLFMHAVGTAVNLENAKV